MNILIHDSFYHPNSLTVQCTRSLQRLGHRVLRIGPSNDLSIPGTSEYFDVADAVERSGERWDLFLFIDNSGNPYFPIALERLPFPTTMLSSDYLAQPADTANESLFPLFDCVISHATGAIPSIRRSNPNVFFVPIGVLDDVFDLEVDRVYQIGQVGGLNHPYRIRVARALQLRYRMNEIDRFYAHAEVREVYSRSRISVNATNHEMVLLNMRMFEVMACGALLITGPTDPAFDEMFEEGKHFLRYHDEQDLFDKIDHYLAHDEERERIARTGQVEVLSHHRFHNRVEAILQILSRLDPRLSAPARRQPPETVAGHYMRAYMRRGEADGVYRTAQRYLSPRDRWRALGPWAGALARQFMVLTGLGQPFILP